MSHEKALAAAVEPIVELVVDLEKQVEELAKRQPEKGEKGEDGLPGRDGADADPDLIVKRILEEHGDSLKGEPGLPGEKGEDGAPGKDAEVDVQQVAKVLAESHGDVLRGKDGKDGADGKDADSDLIVKRIVEEHGDSLKGRDGENGKDGQAGRDGLDGLGLETKAYVPGSVYREGSHVTANLGQFFKALRDTADAPGTSDAWQRIGTAGFRFTGAHDAEKQYEEGDLFIKDFGCFLHVDGKDVLFAGRGAKGERGPVGAQGKDGKDGVDGKDGGRIFAVEQHGLKMLLLQDLPDGTVEQVELDFTDVMSKALEQQVPDILAAVQDVAVSSFQKMVIVHGDDIDAIPIRFFRGVWMADEAYVIGDLVNYGGVTYICSEGNQGVTPRAAFMAEFDHARYWRALNGSGSGGSGGGGGPETVIPNDVLYWAPDTQYKPGDCVFYTESARSSYETLWQNQTGAVIPGAAIFDPQSWTRISSMNNSAWTLSRTNCGLFSGGQLSFVAGTSTVDIAAGRGVYVEPWAENGVGREVIWQATSLDIPALAADYGAIVGIDGLGVPVYFGAGTDASQASRSAIVLGYVAANPLNTAQIGQVISWPVPANDSPNLLNEVLDFFLHAQFVSGGVVEAVAGGMTMHRFQGRVYANGINFHVDPTSPNVKTFPDELPVTFRYIDQLNVIGNVTSTLVPTSYDNAGVPTPITGTQATIQRLYLDLESGQSFVVWGQRVYTDLKDAREQVSNDDANYVKPQSITRAAVFCAHIFMEADTVDVSNTNDAMIVNSNGGAVQGASQGVSDLGGLTDVTLAGIREHQQLTFSGGLWRNQDPNNVSSWQTQPAHGFTTGQVITLNALGQWGLAQANSEGSLAVAMVAEIESADVFRVVSLGRLFWPLHGLTASKELFLSATVPGGVQTSPIYDGVNFNQQVGVVLDQNFILVNVSGARIEMSSSGTGIRRWTEHDSYMVGDYVDCHTDPTSPYGEGRAIFYVHTAINDAPADPLFNTNLTPTDGVFLNGSAGDGSARTYQQAFGYGGQPTYKHFMKTRHVDGNPSGGGFEWFVNDGTADGELATAQPAFHIRGARPYSGGWDEDARAPVDPMELVPKAYCDVGSMLHKAGITGGGNLNSNGGNVNWSQRFIIISLGRSVFCPAGYFDIAMPPNGTIIQGVGGAPDITVANNEIALPGWSALWYRLPFGASNATNNANFMVSNYNTSGDFAPGADWLLVALRNGDTNDTTWCDGTVTPNGAADVGFDSRGVSPQVTLTNPSGIIGYGVKIRFTDWGNRVEVLMGINRGGSFIGDGLVWNIPAEYQPPVLSGGNRAGGFYTARGTNPSTTEVKIENTGTQLIIKSGASGILDVNGSFGWSMNN